MDNGAGGPHNLAKEIHDLSGLLSFGLNLGPDALERVDFTGLFGRRRGWRRGKRLRSLNGAPIGAIDAKKKKTERHVRKHDLNTGRGCDDQPHSIIGCLGTPLEALRKTTRKTETKGMRCEITHGGISRFKIPFSLIPTLFLPNAELLPIRHEARGCTIEARSIDRFKNRSFAGGIDTKAAFQGIAPHEAPPSESMTSMRSSVAAGTSANSRSMIGPESPECFRKSAANNSRRLRSAAVNC